MKKRSKFTTFMFDMNNGRKRITYMTLWMLLDITIIDGVIPAMLVNWLVLVIMHKYYYSKEKINIIN